MSPCANIVLGLTYGREASRYGDGCRTSVYPCAQKGAFVEPLSMRKLNPHRGNIMKKAALLLTIGALLAFGAAQTMTGGAMTGGMGMMTGGAMTGGAMTGGAM